MCGARGSEAQRAEVAARHQGRSTPRGGKLGPPYRGFNQYFTGGLSFFFLNTGGLSFFFLNTGGLSDFWCNTGGLSLFPLNIGVYLIFLIFSQYPDGARQHRRALRLAAAILFLLYLSF